MPLKSADFAWPRQQGPSSRVIKGLGAWQDEGILVPHEAFRWIHQNIKKMMERVDGKEEWRTFLFCNYLEVRYLDSIHHHHDAEEKTYNPAITKAGGKLTENLSVGHKDILAGIVKAKDMIGRVRAGDLQALSELKAYLLTLITDVEEHLAEEEVMYPKALRESGMTKEQEVVVINEIVAGLGLEGNKILLPPILYCMCMWAGEDYMQNWFMENPPPPIRMLVDKCWLNDFHVNHLQVVEAVCNSDAEYTPETPQCGLCVVQ